MANKNTILTPEQEKDLQTFITNLEQVAADSDAYETLKEQIYEKMGDLGITQFTFGDTTIIRKNDYNHSEIEWKKLFAEHPEVEALVDAYRINVRKKGFLQILIDGKSVSKKKKKQAITQASANIPTPAPAPTPAPIKRDPNKVYFGDGYIADISDYLANCEEIELEHGQPQKT